MREYSYKSSESSQPDIHRILSPQLVSRSEHTWSPSVFPSSPFHATHAHDPSLFAPTQGDDLSTWHIYRGRQSSDDASTYRCPARKARYVAVFTCITLYPHLCRSTKNIMCEYTRTRCRRYIRHPSVLLQNPISTKGKGKKKRKGKGKTRPHDGIARCGSSKRRRAVSGAVSGAVSAA